MAPRSSAVWRQRIRALNQFVDDVYHAREIVRARASCPGRLIVEPAHFARPARHPAAARRLHALAGCDLVRDADGTWKVLEDNVRTPSGISYMLENRLAMTRLIPALFAQHRVRPIDQYPHCCTRRCAGSRRSPTSDAPRSSSGRPGRPTAPTSSTPSSPARWASSWSRPRPRRSRRRLLHANDRGLARVDAIYRRLDDAFIDPLEFRPDSLLGVPGLIRAYRAGTVAIANAIGTGVADDKASTATSRR